MCPPDASELDQYAAADVDVSDGDLVLIVGAGTVSEFEDRTTKEVRRRLVIPIKCVEGQVKDLSLNTTSRKAIIVAYGKSSEGWVDKQLAISVVTKDMFGQLKRVIYATPVK